MNVLISVDGIIFEPLSRFSLWRNAEHYKCHIIKKRSNGKLGVVVCHVAIVVPIG